MNYLINKQEKRPQEFFEGKDHRVCLFVGLFCFVLRERAGSWGGAQGEEERILKQTPHSAQSPEQDLDLRTLRS